MDEEQRVISALAAGAPYPTDLADDLHRRLLGALNRPTSSALDIAVLVRQFLRRCSLRDGRAFPVDLVEPVSAQLRTVAPEVGVQETTPGRWTAKVWSPEWLDGGDDGCDEAALAGTEPGYRFHEDPLRADPFFEKLTGFAHYRTAGQRAACRAAITSPEGATLLCMLPTGSGKTEIALTLADRRRSGVTVIVVPTLALAYDFERRFREHYARQNPRIKPGNLHFAWTSKTSESMREGMRNGIVQGTQPLVVTSPESMTRSLRLALMSAAETGRLVGFVIDEAHLVTQWGRSFRPEFRTLADLRRDLLERAAANGWDRPVTLLLSATLGAAEMADLVDLFSAPGPCTPIVANALRSETDIWISRADNLEQRKEWVLEALAHIPRPAILYLTSPEAAEAWLGRLKDRGYRRIARVTGLTLAEERSRVLDALRASGPDDDGVDLVVATSAFGLGIDYAHVRSVVHACLPETVDRWYQEMGRAGRDGAACAEYLLTAPADKNEAESLGVKVLTTKVARDRWADLWSNRRTVDDGEFLDLEGSRGVGRGDYNRRWNAQVVQGLVELRHLRRQLVDVDDLRELLHDDDASLADWTEVKLTSAELGTDEFWLQDWEAWRQQEAKRSREALDRIQAVSTSKLRACDGIAAAYAPTADLVEAWGERVRWMEPQLPCGRCPGCRAAKVPVKLDPPPRPAQLWPVTATELEELHRFVLAARGQNGVAVLTERPGEDLGLALAESLVVHGVRHVAGSVGTWSAALTALPIFRDEAPLAPVDLAPVSSFSRYTGEPVSRHWNRRRARVRTSSDGAPLVDVLLVPVGSRIGGNKVGREIPALAASTALEMLGKA